ncbi:Uncharacterized conserved protein [butyrate-producing bacterium SM4/1]|nr:Uncharacterized conserved protein [butyrate-producing bacterium SM4/1]
MSAFSCEEVIKDLREKQVILGKRNKSDVAEESRFAYKDIDEVMKNQSDLVEPVKKTSHRWCGQGLIPLGLPAGKPFQAAGLGWILCLPPGRCRKIESLHSGEQKPSYIDFSRVRIPPDTERICS